MTSTREAAAPRVATVAAQAAVGLVELAGVVG